MFSSLSQISTSPIVPFTLEAQDTLVLDLSVNNLDLDKINLWETKKFDNWLKDFLRKNQKQAAIGGYLENRRIYQRSSHFEGRSIHLGIDIWAEAGTPIFAPLNGLVHSFQNNTAWGDYGPTIILEHQIGKIHFYTLYGHLSLRSLEGLYEGKKIEKGSQFAEFGDFPVNGDWSPHLHFQIITNLLGKKGDFYGVCMPQEKEKFATLCPNPNLLLRSSLLD
ncbi:MAG: peptidoglycan DD-metalloendopeptidase family protein [Raineya sp.]